MKKLTITLCVALVATATLAQVVRQITIAEAENSASWTNNAGRKANVKLASAFGTLDAGATTNDTLTATVTHNSIVYTVDTGAIASNGTSVAIDFGDEVYAPWGSIVTFTRTADSTNAVVYVMLVTE